MTRAIGTCGLCSGLVIVPSIWMGIYPPTPRCSHCGATPIASHGPVLPMHPAPATVPHHPEKKHHGSHRL